MGYVLHKIPKTDAIFENVNDVLESIDVNNKSTAVISMDDKATKNLLEIPTFSTSFVVIYFFVLNKSKILCSLLIQKFPFALKL